MNDLFDYFAKSARRWPSRPALSLRDKVWSYTELLAAAEKVAAALSERGLNSKGQLFAIVAAKTFSSFAAILGVLGCRSAYMPLNIRWPPSKIEDVISHVGVKAILFDHSLSGSLEPLLSKYSIASVDCDFGDRNTLRLASLTLAGAPPGPPEKQSTSLAYLMFTSGSTGLPKGVPVTNSNASACIESASEELILTAEDRCAQMANLAFDVSVGEMFLCWKAGACLCVPTNSELLNPYSFIRKKRLTIWSSVPSVVRALKRMDLLQKESFPDLRLSMFCGEALPVGLAELWHRAAPTSAIANLYGPTEASIFSTCCIWDGTKLPNGTVPIGTPLKSVLCRTETVVHASSGSQELLLSGPQLVSGYWNSPIETRKAFVVRDDDRIWYRTGDLVGHDPRHGFVFLGRMDSQVKCSGNRVDTAEVANIVAELTCSELAVVVPVLDSDGLCECLVAFCDSLPSEERDIKIECAKQLPDYSLPRRILRLVQFPLSPNGKIDRVALAEMAKKAIG